MGIHRQPGTDAGVAIRHTSRQDHGLEKALDNELIKHPDVEDSCTVGIPHDEYGEEVRAVIQLKAGRLPSEALKVEILNYAASTLAKFKVPRGLDFVEVMPRSEAGKVLRNRVREPYWRGRTRQI